MGGIKDYGVARANYRRRSNEERQETKRFNYYENVCPHCGADAYGNVECLAESGYHHRSVLLRCKCGQKYQYVG